LQTALVVVSVNVTVGAMALTASNMLAFSTQAPDFQLPDVVSGETISLSTFAGKGAASHVHL